MKPEYLMLAQTFKPARVSVAGWFASEKLDGIRAYWDGGLSRGLPASEVPYANTVKDHRLKHEVIATGLWSRTGKVIYAPAYWLDQLPPIPLDGELWLGPRSFQELTSIVSTKDGSKDKEWDRVTQMVFESPPYMQMLKPRKVKVRDYEFEIKSPFMDVMRWARDRALTTGLPIKSSSVKWTFESVYNWLAPRLDGKRARLVPHCQLPLSHQAALDALDELLIKLLATGSEGVMLRKGASWWRPERSHFLLKHKPWEDDEAVLTGFTSGRETAKGSKLLGMIGALIVEYKGKRLELSGLTDKERCFTYKESIDYAIDNPGKDMPPATQGVHFTIGQTITFKYRELSDDGVPLKAGYFRKRAIL